jgi:cell division protein FtsX
VSRGAAAFLIVAAVALSGCGGSNPREVHATLTEPNGCVVRVFFDSRAMSGRAATRNEIRAVRDRIDSSSKVRTYAFVSKELALKRMAKRHPVIARGLKTNPLPEAYEIVPSSADNADELVAELSRAGGVEHVSSKGC